MITNPMFKGSWAARLECLIGGYEITGKRVLDVGCNMGVVGYEVCKQGPAQYTGVDLLTKHLAVARAIFHGVTVPHDFHNCDLVADPWYGETKFDVILLLAVWHHMVKAHGVVATRQAMQPFFDRVTETVIMRGPADDELEEALGQAGLRLANRRPSTNGLYPLSVYRR